MKKLLYQFDTDALPSVFDNVVAYDGGADQVIPYGSVSPENVGGLVEGAIFTRAPKDKKNTAIFVGGGNLLAGEALFQAVQKKFFSNFRVSLMLDSNGANTTAAACVAWLSHGRSLQGMEAVILAGTGPVGQRAAVMLAQEGVRVTLTGRQLDRTQATCDAIAQRFGVTVHALAAPDLASRAAAVQQADIIVGTGAAGVVLLEEAQWKDLPRLKLIADANASPPAGIAGIDLMDKGRERHGKLAFGAIGFGALKLALHRACVARLFEQNDLRLDAAEIYAIAKTMVG
ncbi:MAG: methylenetetrahydrofolate dehydrogenase [Betaproteobacteria bacterium]|nr:methylenetetrahydrofolate dehydrogenase [Betaproteobacteria bacterium]MDE2622606.1 methylenetetrahydrofolate dehydrogenase [Betaproteobacteria bacterium]